MRRSVIVTNSAIAPTITICPRVLASLATDLLTPSRCRLAAGLRTCIWFSRHVCVWIDIDVHCLSRHCRVHNVWLESDRRPFWFWPFSTSCYWNSYFNETASDVLLVDIGDIHIERNWRWTRSRRGRRLPRASDCRPSLLIKRDIGTVSALSNKRFIVVLAAVICTIRCRRWICHTAVAQRSAAGICAAICNIVLFPSFVRCGRPVSYP